MKQLNFEPYINLKSEKYGFKYDDIVFVNKAEDKWKFSDVMVDDAPKVIGSKPLSKVAVKIEQIYNNDVQGDFNIANIKDLTIDLMQHAISKLKNKNTL